MRPCHCCLKTIFSRGFTSKHFNRDEPPLLSHLPSCPLEEESEGEADAERRMRRSSLRRAAESSSDKRTAVIKKNLSFKDDTRENTKSTDLVGWPEFSAAMQAQSSASATSSSI